MAWDSPWDVDSISLAVRMAEDIELARDERQQAAISSLFSREGMLRFNQWADGVRRKIREAQLEARGVADVGNGPRRFIELFGVEES